MIETDGATKNPLIGHEFRYFGDRFCILESSRDTDDQSLRSEYLAAPKAKVPQHVHRDQEESFEVISGTLGIRVGGRELIPYDLAFPAYSLKCVEQVFSEVRIQNLA
jgi:hypothetical protein